MNNRPCNAHASTHPHTHTPHTTHTPGTRYSRARPHDQIAKAPKCQLLPPQTRDRGLLLGCSSTISAESRCTCKASQHCVYTYVCMYVHTHTHTHTHTHCMHTYIRAYIRACMHAFIHVHRHVDDSGTRTTGTRTASRQ